MELTDKLAIGMFEFVELYNEYVESRRLTTGKTRMDEVQFVMTRLRNSYAELDGKKAELNDTWRELKKQMRQAKQSHLL